jgi:hypothetical protein
MCKRFKMLNKVQSPMKPSILASAATMLGLCAMLVGVTPASAVVVNATDSLYTAGGEIPYPSLAGDSGVTSPVAIAVVPGEVITFSSVTGLISCCASPAAFNGADGAAGNGNTQLASYGGISGIYGPTQLFLAGVFGTATNPGSSPPSILDFRTTGAGIGIDFTTLSPLLWQSFFIGDGRTSASTLQSFTVPSLATLLYLGFGDGGGFSGTPCCYSDNRGFLTVTVDINVATTPIPAALPLFASGLGVMGFLARRRKRKNAAALAAT